MHLNFANVIVAADGMLERSNLKKERLFLDGEYDAT